MGLARERLRRWAIVVVGAVVACAGLTVVSTGTAAAAYTVTSTVLVSKTLPINAGSHTNDEVLCPAGTAAAGGGGSATGTPPRGASLTSNSPLFDFGSGAEFLSTEDDGTYAESELVGWNVSAFAAGPGSVTAWTICVPSSGANTTTGVVVVSTFTQTLNVASGAFGATCPTGDVAIGGGVDPIQSQSDNIFVSEPDGFEVNGSPVATQSLASGTYSVPPTGWETTLHLALNDTAAVAAICAPQASVPFLEAVVANGTLPQTASCPAGDEVTGGGAAVPGTTATLEDSTPAGSNAGGPASSWKVDSASATGVASVLCLPVSAATAKVVRLAGSTRIQTAIAISQNRFAAAGSAKAVVLARSDPGEYADALVGAALAAAKDGPLLLTPGSGLDPGTLIEIQRALSAGGTVYVLGGSGAISPAVGTALSTAGYTVVRYGGADRFATAAIVADQGLGDPTTVLEATGLNFPDALSAGAAAAHLGGAVLLTDGPLQAAETASYLAAHPPTSRYAIGGQAAAADPSATSIFGADRYATAAAVAQQLFVSPTTFGAAVGTNYPDALAGAAHIGALGGPLLLVAAGGTLPAATATYLANTSTSLTGGFLYGGTATVGDDVLADLNTAIS
jgi:hypothetical protein